MEQGDLCRSLCSPAATLLEPKTHISTKVTWKLDTMLLPALLFGMLWTLANG